MNKYLICRPEGGLTDIICRLQHSFAYCKKTNRTLIIDTFNSKSFKDDFDIYFHTRSENMIISNTDNISNDLLSPSYSIFPKIDNFDVSNLKFVQNQGWLLNNIKLDFDFHKEYEESVMLYQQCGGCLLNMKFFRLFYFTKLICKMLFERIDQIPKNYTGFHFRGTDLSTDPEIAFDLLKDIKGPVFVASDSYSFIQNAKAKLGKKIFTFSNIPDFLDKPIHLKPIESNLKRQLNCDAILDLIMLSLSDEVVSPADTKSGFTLFAKKLNQIIDISFFEIVSPRLLEILDKKCKNKKKKSNLT
jgi:hypothetical protein